MIGSTSRRTAAVAAGALLLLAACAPGGSTAASSVSTKAPSQISTNVTAAGKITLTVWDQEVRGGQNAEVTELNNQFMTKYPNVTIKRVSRSFTDLKTTLKLALSGKTPPDIVQANQGYPDMVAFVNAGLLQPLDSYEKVYDWTSRYPATLLNLNRVTEDKKSFGAGNLYGVSQTGEYIGLYYNKSALTRLGLKPPTTWDEFTADLATIKTKGQTPIQFGNLDKYPAIHTFGVLQSRSAGPDLVRDLVFGKGGKSFDEPQTTAAATTLQDWATKGYLTAGANGLSYDDAANNFAAGKGVFLLTGTWELSALTSMGDNLGFMVPPPVKAGGPAVTTGGQGLAWAITSKSPNLDVAAKYLDFITNANAADVMTKTGNLPAISGSTASDLPTGSAQAAIVDGWKTLSKDDGLVPYLDYSTPTFYDTITAGLQQLIAAKATPSSFVQTLQADYGKKR